MTTKDNHIILVVDDSDEDFEMLTLAFKSAQVPNPLVRCKDAEEAMAYLKRTPPFEDARRPSIILLDLSLPDIDGRALLRDIKSHDSLRRLPVVVLSTSNNPRDINDCYRDGASSYAIKPLGLDGLERFVRVFREFWLETMVLPS